MKVTFKKILLFLLSIILVAEIGVVFFLSSRTELPVEATESAVTEALATTDTEVPTTAPTETVAPTEPPTEPPTEAPTEPPVTEPKEKHYTLSFAGDCTLGSVKKNWTNPNHFIVTIGENYDYPFEKVRSYFENDDFTLINLEGPLTDSTSGAQDKTFAFRGPTAYTKIMTGSSVEAVTLANNHAEDYGKAGYESTTTVLKEAGITYVERNGSTMHTTERGLKIGLYAAAFSFDTADMKKEIANLRKDGAEIVICAFHWGEEGDYTANADQQKVAKTAIDAGADIVYGHHPHVLQKIEQYNGGYIFYSLGNFSFGGAALPQDYDTALLQLDVVRDENGKVSLGALTAIPCSYRAPSGQNSFQPTPVEEGATYDRILKKLGGDFTGGNLNVDYGKLEPKPEAKPEAKPETQPPVSENPAPAPDTGSSGGESSNEPPSGDGSSSETPSGSGSSSETPSGSGSSSETPSGGGSSSETPSGSGSSSETPSGGGSSDEPPSGGGSSNEPPSGGGSSDEPPSGGEAPAPQDPAPES